MKVLLVDDKGQQVASMENLEQYNAANPGDVCALMDFMEKLIVTAKGNSQRRSSAA